MRVVHTFLAIGLVFAFASQAFAESTYTNTNRDSRQKGPFRNPSNGSLENLDDARRAQQAHEGRSEGASRLLASGDDEDDVTHYHNLARHIGIDLGAMIPFGDFRNSFSSAPTIGMHLSWGAIPPFSFIVSMERSSAPAKDSATNGKLTLTSMNLGAQASFPYKRFSPFAKLEGAFHFNSVNFNDGRRIVSGDDLNVTTIGINAGIGIDFVVGREVGIGLEIKYHYAVPKKLTLTDGTNTSTFDLGSPYVTTGLRVNF